MSLAGIVDGGWQASAINFELMEGDGLGSTWAGKLWDGKVDLFSL